MLENTDPAEVLSRAVALHRADRLDEAETLYQALLTTDAENAGAWHYYGVLCHQQGAGEEAVECLRRALGLDPRNAGAWNNLGIVLRQNGHLEEAANAYLEALKIDPVYAEAFGNLGVAFTGLGLLEEARQALTRALELKPDFAKGYLALATVFQLLERWGEAVGCYRLLIRLEPTYTRAYRGLWRILFYADHKDEALAVLRQWLAIEPDNPYALHMLAAHTGENPPDVASPDYIRMLFDEFAANFDFALREKLEYRAPEVVADAVRQALAGREGPLEVADLGCGTGLCGPLLKPPATRLVGVDLSRKMLEKALGRGVYDELLQADLVAFLEKYPAAFDALASADTLVYIGDLQPFTAAARPALRPGGVAVFTVEKADENQPDGFHLQHNGRYTHRGDYLDKVFGEAGFSKISREEVFLRKEGGEDVRGWLVVAGVGW
jgi:predicted TPR repeat methyltransferase